MITNKTLAILGGMGPEASIDWYKKIISIIKKKYYAVQDYDYPEMYLFNLSLKDWDEKGIRDEKSVRDQLVRAIAKINLLDPSYLIIACNTAHLYYQQIRNISRGHAVNMLTVCVDHIVEKGYKKVGVLCSKTTNDYRLYEECLEDKGITCISTIDQEEITGIIMSVLNGECGMKHLLQLNNHISEMIDRGAQKVILGCTELPVCKALGVDDDNIIDPGLILLDKVTDLLYADVPRFHLG